MVISEKHAKRLIREGKATHGGYAQARESLYYAIVDRHDQSCTDHYYVRSWSREYADCVRAGEGQRRCDSTR